MSSHLYIHRSTLKGSRFLKIKESCLLFFFFCFGLQLNLSSLWAFDFPITVRDFRQDHPDFEANIGDDRGMVAFELGDDGKPVYTGNPTTLTTTGVENFNTWYRDQPEVNTTHQLTLTLIEIEEGVFRYESTAFFPIDHQGHGNEGYEHNFHFTTEAHLYFTYRGGEVLRFSGDDDLFVFMNRKLALDLGGVHASQTAEVNLDELAPMLGLQIGQNYPLDLFHAERHRVQSNFSLTTTIALKVMPGGNPAGLTDPMSSNEDMGIDESSVDFSFDEDMESNRLNDFSMDESTLSDEDQLVNSLSSDQGINSSSSSNHPSTPSDSNNQRGESAPFNPDQSAELASFDMQDSGCQSLYHPHPNPSLIWIQGLFFLFLFQFFRVFSKKEM